MQNILGYFRISRKEEHDNASYFLTLCLLTQTLHVHFAVAQDFDLSSNAFYVLVSDSGS